MFGKKHPLGKGKKNKLHNKKWIIVGVAIILVIVMVVTIMTNAFIFSIGGLLNSVLFHSQEEVPEHTDQNCKCGCIWVTGGEGQNVTVTVGDGTSGFKAGQVDRNNIDSQVVKLIEVIEGKLGDKKVPPYLIYGIANVEAGISDFNTVYANGEKDIYTSVMKPLDGAQYFAGGDLKKGKINKPSPKGAKMIGPFQIHASYYDSWVKLATDDILTEAGGQSPTDITNRGTTGQPLYLPDVVYGHMLNTSYKWDELEKFMSSRYSDWASQPRTVKERMLTAWYCIGYHGGNAGLNHAKKNAAIFDYYYAFSKELDKNPNLLSGVSDWGQAGKYTNTIINTVISAVDADGSKNLKSGFTKYAKEGSTSYLIDWAYGVKVIYLGNEMFNEKLAATGGQLTSGKTDIDIPGYGPSTGSLTDTSNANYSNKEQKVINAFLPGAVAAYELYGIFPSVMIGQKIQESGWGITSSIPNNFYGIKATSSWTGKKGLYWTKEEVNGRVIRIQAYFREYDSFSEGVLGHGDFLASNSRYEKAGVFKADNGQDQVKAIKDAGYATDSGYVSKVVKIMKQSNLENFDNMDYAKKYMQDKGIYSEYEKLVASIQSGSINLVTKGNISNLNNGVGVKVPDSSGTNSGGGYWVCVCEKPCKLCHCHDNETSDKPGNNDGSATTFPSPSPGKASGLWGTAEQLASYIDQLDSSNAPLNANIAQLKKNMKELLGLMGTPSAYPYTYKVDKFKGPDGNGFIYYCQTGKEPYIDLHHQDGVTDGGTFRSSACGLYSVAMMLSTLEKQWVNPAEVAIALQTWGVRNNKRIDTTLMGNSGAAYWGGIKEIFKEAGYTDVLLTSTSMEQSKLDDCLNKGGLVMYVTRDRDFTGSGHYVVIREKTGSGNYLMGNSTRRNDNEYSFNKLKSGSGANTLYVYPKANKGIINGGNGNNNGTGQSDIRSKIVEYSKQFLGVPYVYGGNGPNSFDCSGLTSYIYRNNGYPGITRTATTQYNQYPHITMQQLKPGDLVFFTGKPGNKNITHVGMFIGDGNFIHAPNSNTVVKIEPVTSGYWSTVFVAGGKVIPD